MYLQRYSVKPKVGILHEEEEEEEEKWLGYRMEVSHGGLLVIRSV